VKLLIAKSLCNARSNDVAAKAKKRKGVNITQSKRARELAGKLANGDTAERGSSRELCCPKPVVEIAALVKEVERTCLQARSSLSRLKRLRCFFDDTKRERKVPSVQLGDPPKQMVENIPINFLGLRRRELRWDL